MVCFAAFVLFGLVPLIGFIIVYLIDPSSASGDSDTGKVFYRAPIGEKTEKLDFRPKQNILPHMAIQGVLA